MFNKISSKTLAVIFVLLLIAFAVFIYIDSTQEERTFKRDIVEIDSTNVSTIYIYPKAENHKEIKLFKEGNDWKVQLSENKTVPADESKINSLIQQVSQIEANSVAAMGEEKWNEFEVDTTGTRIKILEDDEIVLDLTIGKFTFQQPRTMLTYVRVKGDENVYEVDGFLGMSVNQNANFFRNNKIVNDDVKNWDRLTYNYPDSSFQLIKDTTNTWTINGEEIDSAKTVNYLRTLSRLTGTEFIDNVDELSLGRPEYKLNIASSALGTINVSAYVDSTRYIIHSSQNPDAYFNGKANDLYKKIFVGKEFFLN